MDDSAREALAAAVMDDWRTARLGPADRALCEFATKLTGSPGSQEEADVETLRAAGFGDEAIHDAVQVVAYFNYINRVAEAVHVDLEPEMPPYPDPGCS